MRAATSQFLNDPKSAGIGVGLGYFGKQPIGQASCNEDDYAAPRVGIGQLPEHASTVMSASRILRAYVRSRLRNRFFAIESETEPLVFMPTRRPSAS